MVGQVSLWGYNMAETPSDTSGSEVCLLKLSFILVWQSVSIYYSIIGINYSIIGVRLKNVQPFL